MRQKAYVPSDKYRTIKGTELRRSLQHSIQNKQHQWKQMRQVPDRFSTIQPSLYSLAAESSMLLQGMELPRGRDPRFQVRDKRSQSQMIAKAQDVEKSMLRVNKGLKLHRYTRNQLRKQMLQAKKQPGEDHFGFLKKIIDQYNIKSQQRAYYANLVNNLGLKISNDIHSNKKLITVKGKIKAAESKNQKDCKSTLYNCYKGNHFQQLESLAIQQLLQPQIKLQAQSINRCFKKDTSLLAGSIAREKGMSSTNYGRHLYPSLGKGEGAESRASLLEMTDNSVVQKVNKYKEFLFMINFAHKIYRDLDIAKHQTVFKVYIGSGNNSNLIRAIVKKRFWLTEVTKKQEAHLIWTQLKQETVLHKQAASSSRQQAKLSQEKANQCCTQFVCTQIGLLTVPDICRKEKKNRVEFKPGDIFLPHLRILTKEQLKDYNSLMQRFSLRKKGLFGQRLKYLKGWKAQQLGEVDHLTVHNHFNNNGFLGNKKAMFYMLRQYCRLTKNNVNDYVPVTFHVKKYEGDEDFQRFLNIFTDKRNANRPNYWIVKPGQFSNRGQGISCTAKIEQVKARVSNLRKQGKGKSLIIQEYIANPLLYNGRKFDIRTYMLITVNNAKLRAYWYQDGYIRTSGYLWKLESISDSYVHLTNDAIQKYADNYGKYQPGNKLSYNDLQRYIDSLPHSQSSKTNLQKHIIPKIRRMATDAVRATFAFIDPSRHANNFQIFGLDFMIDADFKPWLIEINTNPCLQLSCPILERIIPSMVENAFRIAVDSIFTPPLNYSSTYKYNIPENALHYNKFQLIFDEESEGAALRDLYKDSTIAQQIEDYEQDQQQYEEIGDELDL